MAEQLGIGTRQYNLIDVDGNENNGQFIYSHLSLILLVLLLFV